jgi:PhzF family phenazine biosynthesis protein
MKLYQVDAFTSELFGGNPAAVCPLKEWIEDELMQKIAMENNLAETAFYVQKGDVFELRWFTPTLEVDLCGHATLAAAHVLFEFEGFTGSEIEFLSPRSGKLTVRKDDGLLTLNFPVDSYAETLLTEPLRDCLDIAPYKAYKGKTDYMLVYKTEEEVSRVKPDFNKMMKISARGIIITAPGNEVDFVSRFFAPQSGVNEDPVTGSAHTTLTPYWATRMGKNELTALQLSERRGELKCKYLVDRVEISGKARAYLRGEILI